MSSSLSDVQARTGAVATVAPIASSLGAESDRAVATIQAAYTIAKRFPRDVQESISRIKNMCKVIEVAEDSEYKYNRGGNAVGGPNIRIAEIIASQWGNIEYATVEIVRGQGESLCEAYAVDLETNARSRTQFVVPHRRDTKDDAGSAQNKLLTSDRDIYEMIANMGSRRVREQIFRVIPKYVVDAAIDECRKTKSEFNKKRPLKDRIAEMVPAFEKLGVTKPMLAKWLKCAPEDMLEQQFVDLKDIWRSIRDQQARKEDFFEVDTVPTANTVKPGTPAGPVEDADKQIPQTEKDKKAESPEDPPKEKPAEKPAAEKKAAPASDGPPGYDEIKGMVEAAKDGDKLVEIMSLTTNNKSLDKKQAAELRKLINDKMTEFVE